MSHGPDSPSRRALLGRNSGWSTSNEDEYEGGESEDTRHINVHQLRQNQHHIIQEQDRGLEALSEVISRQKHIASTINNEVEIQNELIEDITDHVDRTRDRLVGETNRVRTIDRKDNTCGYWSVIILLLLAIIIVSSI